MALCCVRTAGDGMEVKLLKEPDTEQYAKLRLQAIGEGFTVAPLGHAMSFRAMAMTGLCGDTQVWGAFDETRLAGVAALSNGSGIASAGYLWLWGLYVRPSYRGTPASRCLMEMALEAVERAPDEVRLLAAYAENNYRAHQLFTRWAFHPCGSRPASRLPAVLPGEVLVERHRRRAWALSA